MPDARNINMGSSVYHSQYNKPWLGMSAKIKGSVKK